MRKLPATHKTILRQSGDVYLVKLERFDCAQELYGVTFPQKIGRNEGTNTYNDGPPLCEQFMTEAEAVRAYARYVKFFEERKNAKV